MNKTGVVADPFYILHDPGIGHPESPDRLRSIYSHLENLGFRKRTVEVVPRPGTRDEICRIHAKDYYERVKGTKGRSVSLDPDTSTSPDSFQAAELAVGGVIVLVEAVASGRLDNGYALVRPPGHHAERDRAMGFCLFNNVAIAAQHARVELGMERVLIVDWDLHHGNGTMHSFYDRDDVLYFSTHQYPYYPGTGSIEQIGEGRGEGFTVNVPLVAGMGDKEYRAVFRKTLAPIVRQFAPELILVSTGFDTYHQDPLGGMRMTAEGYGLLTSDLMEMSTESAMGKLVLVLEGGYELDGLSRGVEYSLRALIGEWTAQPYDNNSTKAKAVIESVQNIHASHWEF